MSLNINDIHELMSNLENSSLREFKIVDGDFSLHLSKNENAAVVNTSNAVATPAAPLPAVTTETPSADYPLAQPSNDGVEIVAPMVGTVYLQPKPEAPMFKSVGDKVAVGETVAVIEAMKLMTEIHSDVAGTVSKILVENEEVVDYNKPLYIIDKD